MLIWTFFMWAWAGESQDHWVFRNTGIYQMLNQHLICANEAGEIFVLNRKEKHFLKISVNGDKSQKFGQPGMGPGELQMPMQIHADRDRVYVYDIYPKKVLVYDRDGQYLEEHRFQNRPMQIIKTPGGWLAQASGRENRGKGPRSVYWYTHPESEPKVLFKPHVDLQAQKSPMKPIRRFNPAPTRVRLGQSLTDQKFVVVYPGIQPKIAIYDSQTGKLLHTYAEKRTPVPFNKPWAEEKYKEMQDAQKKFKGQLPKGMYSEADFPDFFPFAKNVWVYEDGHIYVETWSGNPDKDSELWCFNFQGKRVRTSLPASAMRQVFHMTQTHVWVHKFDTKRDEVSIAKVPRSKWSLP